MSMRRTSALACLLLFAACGSPEPAAELAVDRSTSGDTTRFVWAGEPPQIRVEEVEVEWRSARLEFPRTAALIGQNIVIADRQHIHLVGPGFERPLTVGGDGEGPGEFRWVGAVGPAPGDSIAVYDSRLGRISIFGGNGSFGRTVFFLSRFPFVDQLSWGLRVTHDGVFALKREGLNTSTPEPAHIVLIQYDPETEDYRIHRKWPDLYMKLAEPRPGQMQGVVPERFFTPRAILALSPRGEVAHGDGLEYCFHIEPVLPGEGHRVEHVCRERERVRASEAMRRPDWSLIEDEADRQRASGAAAQVPVERRLPSYDLFRFDAQGRLWVRTMGEEVNVHPWLITRIRELQPSHRNWDVFDEDRALIATVQLPYTFDVRTFSQGRIYGFIELEWGEIAFASAELPI